MQVLPGPENWASRGTRRASKGTQTRRESPAAVSREVSRRMPSSSVACLWLRQVSAGSDALSPPELSAGGDRAARPQSTNVPDCYLPVLAHLGAEDAVSGLNRQFDHLDCDLQVFQRAGAP